MTSVSVVIIADVLVKTTAVRSYVQNAVVMNAVSLVNIHVR